MGNNNNLNKRIIENVRNRVVISNIESEVNMKLSKRKQILSVVTVCMIMIGGSIGSIIGGIIHYIKRNLTKM